LFSKNSLLEHFMATDASLLVIGATGSIGSETALAFSRRGFRIRASSAAAEGSQQIRASQFRLGLCRSLELSPAAASIIAK